jgi:hypothetical protein
MLKICSTLRLTSGLSIFAQLVSIWPLTKCSALLSINQNHAMTDVAIHGTRPLLIIMMKQSAIARRPYLHRRHYRQRLLSSVYLNILILQSPNTFNLAMARISSSENSDRTLINNSSWTLNQMATIVKILVVTTEHQTRFHRMMP